MFHLLYISCISITLLIFLSPSHGAGLACNIIFVFLCLASSRFIARVIGFSRFNLCVWSMGLCYSQVSQTYLRIRFSLTSLFHQLRFHSWIFVGKIRFCVPNRQLTRDSKSPFSVFYVRTGNLFFPSIVGLFFKSCKLECMRFSKITVNFTAKKN